jgi:hypothetical protein
MQVTAKNKIGKRFFNEDLYFAFGTFLTLLFIASGRQLMKRKMTA